MEEGKEEERGGSLGIPHVSQRKLLGERDEERPSMMLVLGHFLLTWGALQNHQSLHSVTWGEVQLEVTSHLSGKWLPSLGMQPV
jgi:hypothetical protein